jgi:hypothetical protein
MRRWGYGSPNDPGLPPDLHRQEPLKGAQTVAPPPHGGLRFLLEAIPAVEVEEELGEAPVPGREEVDQHSGRPDLEDEEEQAKVMIVVRDKGQQGE